MRRRLLPVPPVVLAALLTGCSGGTATPASTTAAPASAGASATVAGNGIESLSAPEILARSQAALAAAPSFHLKLTATVAGFVVVSEMDAVGRNLKGTQTGQAQPVEFIRIGDDLYVKAGDGFWSTIVSLSQIAHLSSKWVKVPASSPTFSALIPDPKTMLSNATGVTKSGSSTLDGKPVVGLTSQGSTVYVATDGEPYPVKVEGTQNTEFGPGTLVAEFSRYGAVTTTITAPTGEIVDISTT